MLRAPGALSFEVFPVAQRSTPLQQRRRPQIANQTNDPLGIRAQNIAEELVVATAMASRQISGRQARFYGCAARALNWAR